jgi:hypothetical protein
MLKHSSGFVTPGKTRGSEGCLQNIRAPMSVSDRRCQTGAAALATGLLAHAPSRRELDTPIGKVSVSAA